MGDVADGRGHDFNLVSREFWNVTGRVSRGSEAGRKFLGSCVVTLTSNRAGKNSSQILFQTFVGAFLEFWLL
jgi:hypothetical protein